MRSFLFTHLIVLAPCVIPVSAQTPQWLWARNGIGLEYDQATAVTTDPSGNVLVAGYFSSDSITFGGITLQNNTIGSNDLFLVKYDPDGSVLWARSAGATLDDEADAVATDAGGNIYLTGNFYSPQLILGTDTLTNAGNVGDIFIAKYDPDGNMLWARRDGGPGLEIPHDIGVDQAGNFVVAGRFSSNSVIFGTDTLQQAGSMDVFVVKYDAAGNVLWAVGAGGGSNDEAEALAIDPDGDIILAGYYTQQAAFGTFTLPNPGSNNVFIAKCDGATGAFTWAKWAGSDGVEEALDLALDAQNNIYVAGHFQSDSLVFGTTTLHSTAFDNGFVARFDEDGDPVWAHGLNARSRAEGVVVVNNAVYACGDFHEDSLNYGPNSLPVAGTTDLFLLKSDLAGNPQWVVKQTSGGESGEIVRDLAADPSGHLVLAGGFNSDEIAFGSAELTLSNGFDMFVLRMGDPDIGIDDPPGEEAIRLYPNPASGFFVLEGPPGMERVEIFDALGALHYAADLSAGRRRVEVHAEALCPGIHQVRLTVNGHQGVKKLVVE